MEEVPFNPRVAMHTQLPWRGLAIPTLRSALTLERRFWHPLWRGGKKWLTSQWVAGQTLVLPKAAQLSSDKNSTKIPPRKTC